MYAPLREVRKPAGKILSSWKEIGSGDSINPLDFVGLISHWAIINLDNWYSVMGDSVQCVYDDQKS